MEDKTVWNPARVNCNAPGVIVAIILIILGMVLSSVAEAGQMNLLINGKARHIDSASKNYNESNWGLGFQYDYDKTKKNRVKFIGGGGFKDSYNKGSYYFGGGYGRQFTISERLDNLHVDVVMTGFVMTRQDFKNGDPFLGVLPMLSIGTDRVAVNITYVPKVKPKMAALIFYQLKIAF